MNKITAIGDLHGLVGTKPYVSFDLFDTLLKRRFVGPHQVHDTVSAFVLAQIGERRHRSPSDLTLLRYRMTDALKASSKQEIQEPVLSLIWDRILLRDVPDPAERSALVEQVVAFEFAIEAANLALVEGARDLLIRLRAEGKVLVAISDMYFNQAQVRAILEKLRIADQFDHLYVSAEVNLTKQTGDIFKRVLSDLGIGPYDLIHVGDNQHSDVAMARKVGVTPILVEQPQALQLERPAYGRRERIEEEVADLVKLHLFSLLFDARDRRVEHIYFMGRDGCAISLFLDGWDSIFAKSFLKPPAYSDAFLNRILTCWGGVDFSGPWLVQAIGFAFWLNHGRATARELSALLGIEEVPADLEVGELDSSVDTDRTVRAYQEADLAPKIRASILEKRRQLKRHLEDIGFFSRKSVAFSDVGYSGTVLRDLNTLFLSHASEEEKLIPPEMVLHLLATNDNYRINRPRAFPFVAFSRQVVLPAEQLNEDLKGSFAWLEFFFKHPTLRPILRFIETEQGLLPELVHDEPQDAPGPGDRVRAFGFVRDQDVALLWMAAVNSHDELIDPIIDRFARPDPDTVEQMRDEVFELHAVQGARRSIILDIPGATQEVVAAAARKDDYWIPGSILASTHALGEAAEAKATAASKATSSGWTSLLRKMRRRVARRMAEPLQPVRGFDPRFYGSYYNDLRHFRTHEELLHHYRKHGRAEGRLISSKALAAQLSAECGPIPEDFDGNLYLYLNPDISGSVDTPEQAQNHYMRIGRHEGRRYRVDQDRLAAEFERLFSTGALTFDDEERRLHERGETGLALFLRRHGLKVGPWIAELNVAEFRALHADWCGPVSTKAECIIVLAEKGLSRLPSLSMRSPFDEEYYRASSPDLSALAPPDLYRHYLNVGIVTGVDPSEEAGLLKLWGSSEFPRCFNWEAYRDRGNPALRNASRLAVIKRFVDEPGLSRMKFIQGSDRAPFLEFLAMRAWRPHGRTGEAMALYEAALKSGGSAGRIYHFLGDLAREAGESSRALAYYRRGIADVAPDRWSFIHAAELLADAGSFEAAMAVLASGQKVWQEMAPWRRTRDAVLKRWCEMWVDQTRKNAAINPDLRKLDAIVEEIAQRLPTNVGFEGRIGKGLLVTSRPVSVAQRDRALAEGIETVSTHGLNADDLLGRLLSHKLIVFHEAPCNFDVLYAIRMAQSLGCRTVAWSGDLTEWEGRRFDEGLWAERDREGIAFRLTNFWESALVARYCGEGVTSLPGVVRSLAAVAPDCLIHRVQNVRHADRGARGPYVVLVVPHFDASDRELAELAKGLRDAAATEARLSFLIDARLAARPELREVAGRYALIERDMELPSFFRLAATVDAIVQIEPASWRAYASWLDADALGIPSLVVPARAHVDRKPSRAGAALSGVSRDLGTDLATLPSDPPVALERIAVTDEILPVLRHPDKAPTKPRILFANVFFAPQVIGGATRVLKDNIDYLLDHHAHEFEFAVFCSDEQNSHSGEWRVDSYRGIPVFRVATPQEINMDWRGANEMVHAKFAAVLDSFRPDFVHIHCLQRLTVTVAHACLARELPYLVTLHDAWWISDFPFLTDEQGMCVSAKADFHDQPMLTDVGVGRSVERAALLRSALAGATDRLAVSRSFANIYEACGISCHVIENGTSRIERAPRSIASGQRVQLCHIGGLQHHKGAYLIEIALRNNAYTNLEYTVIDLARGPSDTVQTSWGTTPVTIRGKLSGNDLSQFYAWMNVLLAPSTWPESYGLVTREALAHGLWVIASELGSTADPVVEGKNGFIISVSDAQGVAAALRVIDEAPEKFQRSPDDVAVLRTADDQARDLLDIYRQMVAGCRNGPADSIQAQAVAG